MCGASEIKAVTFRDGECCLSVVSGLSPYEKLGTPEDKIGDKTVPNGSSNEIVVGRMSNRESSNSPCLRAEFECAVVEEESPVCSRVDKVSCATISDALVVAW